jgi:hypothetical protein
MRMEIAKKCIPNVVLLCKTDYSDEAASHSAEEKARALKIYNLNLFEAKFSIKY